MSFQVRYKYYYKPNLFTNCGSSLGWHFYSVGSLFFHVCTSVCQLRINKSQTLGGIWAFGKFPVSDSMRGGAPPSIILVQTCSSMDLDKFPYFYWKTEKILLLNYSWSHLATFAQSLSPQLPQFYLYLPEFLITLLYENSGWICNCEKGLTSFNKKPWLAIDLVK